MRHCAYATPVYNEKSNAWKHLIDADQDCMHGQRRKPGFWSDEERANKMRRSHRPQPVSVTRPQTHHRRQARSGR